MRPQPGLALGGRYRLIRQIAVGGMGEVWVAKDESLARDIAIKVLKEEFVGNPDFLNRFRVEARNAASLSHAHIAQLYDYGEQDGSAYLVMELVHGEPMSDLLEREPILPVGKLLHILSQTARGLHAAHVGGVVHRDIKPGNIILETSGDVKITDFGVSLAANQVPMTAAGMVMGTAQYLSPEQAIGRPATGASDIYALGIVAYEAIAGNRPFTGKTPVDIAVAHVNEPVPPLPSRTHPELAAVVMRMLAKDPLERPRSGAALAHTFEEIARKLNENPRVSNALANASTAVDPRVETNMRPVSPAHGNASLRPPVRGEINLDVRPGSDSNTTLQPRATAHGQSVQNHNAPGASHATPSASDAPLQSQRAVPPVHRAPQAGDAATRRAPAEPQRSGQPEQASRRTYHAQTRAGQAQRGEATRTSNAGGPGAQPARRISSSSARSTHASTHDASRAGSQAHLPSAARPTRAAQRSTSSAQRDVQNQVGTAGIKDRILGLGGFTLALIGVILAILLATAVKAMVAQDGGQPSNITSHLSQSIWREHTTEYPGDTSFSGRTPTVAEIFSSVQFTSDASVGIAVGQHRGAGPNFASSAQAVKDA